MATDLPENYSKFLYKSIFYIYIFIKQGMHPKSKVIDDECIITLHLKHCRHILSENLKLKPKLNEQKM